MALRPISMFCFTIRAAVMNAFHRRPAIGCHHTFYLQPSRAGGLWFAFGPSRRTPIPFKRTRSGIEQVEKIAAPLPQVRPAHLGIRCWQTPFKQKLPGRLFAQPALTRSARSKVVVVILLAIKARFHASAG